MDSVRKKVLRVEPPVDGAGVRVAIVDTGVDSDHPDLTKAIRHTFSTCSACLTDDTTDKDGHGTHIAGIIAGSGSLSDGKYRGIAPGVTLACYKVAHGRKALGADVAKAVEMALDWGADIINYSAGQNGPYPPPWKWASKLAARDRAFQAAAEAGILCVAAAGNDGPHYGSINRPAALPEVLAVGAMGEDGFVSQCSSRGPVYVDHSLGRGDVQRLDLTTDDLKELTQFGSLKPDVVAPGGTPREPPQLSVWRRSFRFRELVLSVASANTLASTFLWTIANPNISTPELPGPAKRPLWFQG